MEEYITRAFKSLEDIDVKIEPITTKTYTLKEAQEEIGIDTEDTEAKTVRELFLQYGSYVFTHDFEFEGQIYSLFFEALNDGNAADLLFDEFKIENIDDVLIQVLDEEHNFVAELDELPTDRLEEADEDEIDPLDVKVDDVVAAAEEAISQDEEKPVDVKPEPKEEMIKKEETLQLTGFNESQSSSQFFAGEDGDVMAAEFVSEKNLKNYRIEWDSEKNGYNISWGALPIEEDKTESEETEDVGTEPKPYLPKSTIVSGDILVDEIEDLQDEEKVLQGIENWLEHEYGFLFTGFDFEVKDNMVHIKNIGWDTSESLKESQQFSVRDKDEMAQAKEIIDATHDEDRVEQIVDVNAETVEDLKKSYIGSTILQCPVCRTMIYKDPKDLVKEEGETPEGEKLYNEGEDCPHCGAKDGFHLVGQVASLDVNPEEKPEPPMVEPSEPGSEQPEEEKKEEPEEEEEMVELTDEEPEKENKGRKISLVPEEPVEESLSNIKTESKEVIKEDMNEKYQDVLLEEFDENKFDRLAKKYLNEVYNNITSYVTKQGKVDNNSNKIIIEGTITFNSGKTKDTVFIFEAREITKKGKVRFVGINETFTKKKAFTLVGTFEDSKMLSESLTYSYKVEDRKVYGQVKNPTKI
jgi:ribosomal protein S17E